MNRTAAKRYTHFVDLMDGTGFYRDYNDTETVLLRHSQSVKNPNTARSWVEEYDPETGNGVQRLADWYKDSPPLHSLT